MGEFQVPTVPLPAEVLTVEGRKLAGRIFVPAAASKHTGAMRAEEWMEEGQPFFPFLADGAPSSVILNKRQVVALSLPIEGFDGPVGVVNLARPTPARAFDEPEMMAVARFLYPIGVAVERVHRSVLAERSLRQLKSPPGEWVHTMMPEGATASRSFRALSLNNLVNSLPRYDTVTSFCSDNVSAASTAPLPPPITRIFSFAYCLGL